MKPVKGTMGNLYRLRQVLEHDMDAVILANYFHQHAPFAIKALDAGFHVMSETTAVITMAEGVALINKVEETKKIYMLAENYPYFRYNQEMRRLYREGEIGEMVYGEGEYVHPMSVEDKNKISPGFRHWRNNLPATYYNTHALAPIMYITDTIPVKVNALCIPYLDSDEQTPLLPQKGDTSSVILTRMNNESVVRTIGVNLRGHGNWYRIHGTRGLMENLRTFDQQMLRVKHDAFEMREEIEESTSLSFRFLRMQPKGPDTVEAIFIPTTFLPKPYGPAKRRILTCTAPLPCPPLPSKATSRLMHTVRLTKSPTLRTVFRQEKNTKTTIGVPCRNLRMFSRTSLTPVCTATSP